MSDEEVVSEGLETDQLRQRLAGRLPGLVKAISEEMEPGSREFCLAAVDELVEYVSRLQALTDGVPMSREAGPDANRQGEEGT